MMRRDALCWTVIMLNKLRCVDASQQRVDVTFRYEAHLPSVLAAARISFRLKRIRESSRFILKSGVVVVGTVLPHSPWLLSQLCLCLAPIYPQSF